MMPNLTKGSSISDAIGYAMSEGSELDKRGNVKERRVGESPRAEILGGQNFGFEIDSPERLELARKIMEWSALPENQGSRTQPVKNDALHVSLAWHKGYQPDNDEMLRAGGDCLKALGMESARAVFIAHHDTDQFHIHVIASRINPETGLAFSDTRDMTKLHAWSLRWERENDQISEARRPLHKAVDGIRQGDTGLALDYLTDKKATFTKRELGTLLGYAELSDEQREKLTLGILADHGVIHLKETADAKVTHYTTREILLAERKVMQAAARMEEREKFGIAEKDIAAIAKAKTLTAEQEAALRHITGREGFAVIAGEAGTGKSWVMDAGRELYEAAGYQVIGTSTTHAVVQDMRADGFQKANTLASELLREESRRATWNSRTVIFLDEAAMVSTKNLADLMTKADAAGAKVIAAGDDRQLSSIDSGGLFRPLADQRGAAVLTEVFRTKDAEQGRAYNLMHEGRFAEALGIFEAKGAINWTDTQKDALEGVAKKYGADMAADPGKTRFIFAYTNADVKALNTFARELAKHHGRVEGEDVTVQTAEGKAAFAKGDRIQFTGNAANATDRSRGMTNGTAGTVRAVETKDEQQFMTVELDARKGQEPRVVSFAVGENKVMGEFDAFRHGYAGTIYKGQGRTLDQTYVYHSHHWQASAGYVALSRHRESVSLFVARETAATVGELARQIGRDDRKRAASSFHTELRDGQAAAIGRDLVALQPADEQQAFGREARRAWARAYAGRDYEAEFAAWNDRYNAMRQSRGAPSARQERVTGRAPQEREQMAGRAPSGDGGRTAARLAGGVANVIGSTLETLSGILESLLIGSTSFPEEAQQRVVEPPPRRVEAFDPTRYSDEEKAQRRAARDQQYGEGAGETSSREAADMEARQRRENALRR